MDQQTPISARASASDPSIATQGPIPLFDVHLRFLAESYITFFQERCATPLPFSLSGSPFLQKTHRRGLVSRPSQFHHSQIVHPCSLISIESLKKLHRKTKSADAYLEDKGELSTTRSAWAEVRDNLERGVPNIHSGCSY